MALISLHLGEKAKAQRVFELWAPGVDSKPNASNNTHICESFWRLNNQDEAKDKAPKSSTDLVSPGNTNADLGESREILETGTQMAMSTFGSHGEEGK